jgi:predicted MFS family arabinose efflux permease
MGWRIGFVFMGAMTLLPLPAAFLWLHERRETAGRTPVPPETGYQMLEVLRLRAFWLIGLGGLLYFLCYMGVQFSLVPFLTDRGMSRANAAYYAGVCWGPLRLLENSLQELFSTDHARPSCLLSYC